jgi:hypothetical protein
MIPEGINQILDLSGPGNAIIKLENKANKMIPLQGSPIHNPLVLSIPIKRTAPVKVLNPNKLRIHLLCLMVNSTTVRSSELLE